jgi:hypothetical protein
MKKKYKIHNSDYAVWDRHHFIKTEGVLSVRQYPYEDYFPDNSAKRLKKPRVTHQVAVLYELAQYEIEYGYKSKKQADAMAQRLRELLIRNPRS